MRLWPSRDQTIVRLRAEIARLQQELADLRIGLRVGEMTARATSRVMREARVLVRRRSATVVRLWAALRAARRERDALRARCAECPDCPDVAERARRAGL